jgi:N-acetylmuramoyl-L-alanine amidase
MPLPLAADGLITETGVMVAVLEQTSNGFTVRTPCGNEVTVRGGDPVGQVDIVIDPGHGGAPDPGAVSSNGLKEASINLEVARAMQDLLAGRGFVVALTRTSDYTSPLGVRAALADHLGAKIMISIHHNAPTANLSSEPGTEVFIQHARFESRRLGELVYSYLTQALREFEGIVWSSAPDAGAIEVLNTRGSDAYGMLRTPTTVTVLAELAYISHRPEADLFLTPEYTAATAAALADAVEAYLTSEASGSGFVPIPRVFNPQRGISADVCEDPDLE